MISDVSTAPGIGDAPQLAGDPFGETIKEFLAGSALCICCSCGADLANQQMTASTASCV